MAKQALVEAETPKYVMPDVSVGETVLFYTDADATREGIPMVVLSLGGEAIAGMLQSLDSVRMRDSVRHVSDPKLKEKPRMREYGSWDYGPVGERLRAVESTLRASGLLDTKK